MCCWIVDSNFAVIRINDSVFEEYFNDGRECVRNLLLKCCFLESDLYFQVRCGTTGFCIDNVCVYSLLFVFIDTTFVFALRVVFFAIRFFLIP